MSPPGKGGILVKTCPGSSPTWPTSPTSWTGRASNARDIAAALPRGRLWLAEGAGHMVPQEIPDRFIQRVLGFMDEVLSRPG